MLANFHKVTHTSVKYKGIYYKWYNLPFVSKWLLFVLILLLSVHNIYNAMQTQQEKEWTNSYRKAIDVCLQGGNVPNGYAHVRFGKHVFECKMQFLTEV